MRTWKVAVGFLTIVALTAIWWGNTERRRADYISNRLNATYNAAFLDLVSYVDAVEVRLGKGTVASSSDQILNQLTDVWRQSNLGKAALSRLPVRSGAFMRTSKFLTQVGDFSYVMARKRAGGQKMTDGDLATMTRLRRQAVALGKELHGLQRMAAAGNYNWLTNRTPNPRRVGQSDSPGGNAVTDNFKSVDRAMADYPTLQYDGPFSDRIDKLSPRGLTGSNVSQAEAARRALRLTPDPARYRARFKGMTRGRLVAYGFDLVPTGGDLPRMAADVSQKGGHVVWAVNTRPPGPPRLSSADAARAARDFLRKLDLPELRESYAQTVGGVVTFPYVAVENNVLIYPDMVKVAVALDRGEVLSFDALQYLTNHHTRSKADLTPTITAEQARAKLKDGLTVQGTQLTVIPREVAGEESLAWEFKCTQDNEPYYVYVNAKTGREERILKIVSTPQGKLTM
ncbi:MAG: germination protein YpeB [Chitinophagales bacterium]